MKSTTLITIILLLICFSSCKSKHRFTASQLITEHRDNDISAAEQSQSLSTATAASITRKDSLSVSNDSAGVRKTRIREDYDSSGTLRSRTTDIEESSSKKQSINHTTDKRSTNSGSSVKSQFQKKLKDRTKTNSETRNKSDSKSETTGFPTWKLLIFIVISAGFLAFMIKIKAFPWLRNLFGNQ